jgi:hypothetical protein
MAWTDPNPPNIADFNDFIANSMQVPASALAPGSPYPQFALSRGIDIVFNLPGIVSQLEYTQAVYNCAAHFLISLTPDVIPVVVYQDNLGFFTYTRQSLDLNSFQAGVISSSSDESTSNSMTIPESLTNLTVGDLDFLKTPWGRQYIAYAQDFGQIAGLS